MAGPYEIEILQTLDTSGEDFDLSEFGMKQAPVTLNITGSTFEPGGYDR